MNMKKIAVVTGASSGIGAETAKLLVKHGFVVYGAARRVDKMQRLLEDGIRLLEMDVTDDASMVNGVGEVLAAEGRVDVLVNNAGIGYFGAIEESEEAEVRRMFEINVFGLAHMTQAVLPIMRKQRSGHILNIASIGGLRSFPGVGFYNATKYAVDGLSESLSKEVAPLGIKVTIVAPSGFRTDWAGR